MMTLQEGVYASDGHDKKRPHFPAIFNANVHRTNLREALYRLDTGFLLILADSSKQEIEGRLLRVLQQ